MIVTFTDFGPGGPYLAQMHAALRRISPSAAILDAVSNAPRCNPRASSYLLAALVPQFPRSTIFLGVVDPGVGTERQPLIMTCGSYWFVGPDNGLFEIAARQTGHAQWWRITDQPENLSSTFHGRDLFAPAAARLVTGQGHTGEPTQPASIDWPDDLAEIIYIDDYGNAMTGLRGGALGQDAELTLGSNTFRYAETFARANQGFWYINSIGLVEIACPGGSAAATHDLKIGDPIGSTELPGCDSLLD